MQGGCWRGNTLHLMPQTPPRLASIWCLWCTGDEGRETHQEMVNCGDSQAMPCQGLVSTIQEVGDLCWRWFCQGGLYWEDVLR